MTEEVLHKCYKCEEDVDEATAHFGLDEGTMCDECYEQRVLEMTYDLSGDRI